MKVRPDLFVPVVKQKNKGSRVHCVFVEFEAEQHSGPSPAWTEASSVSTQLSRHSVSTHRRRDVCKYKSVGFNLDPVSASFEITGPAGYSNAFSVMRKTLTHTCENVNLTDGDL